VAAGAGRAGAGVAALGDAQPAAAAGPFQRASELRLRAAAHGGDARGAGVGLGAGAGGLSYAAQRRLPAGARLDGIVPCGVVGLGGGRLAEPRPMGPGGGLRGDAGKGLAVGVGPAEGDQLVRGATSGIVEAPGAGLFAVVRADDRVGGAAV